MNEFNDNLKKINFGLLSEKDKEAVLKAIMEGKDFVGYISIEESLSLILENRKIFSLLNILECNWMQTYMNSTNFEQTSLKDLKNVFDLCDKNVLQKMYPVPSLNPEISTDRYTLFRGCAGPYHKKGMSWTSSLDYAIHFAARHVSFHKLSNPAVYATTVHISEIYCYGNRHENDFIVLPKKWWKVEIPEEEFRLDIER